MIDSFHGTVALFGQIDDDVFFFFFLFFFSFASLLLVLRGGESFQLSLLCAHVNLNVRQRRAYRRIDDFNVTFVVRT